MEGNDQKLIGWQSDERTADAIIENKIVETFKEVVSVSTTDAGAISLSVTHENPERAAFYANELMEFTRDLVLDEQEESTDLRLNYLSETLADALQEMERTRERLKLYALENSTVANQSFVAGSLQLDQLRSERQDALEFTTTLTRLEEMVKLGALDQNAYLTLRDTNPMIDDVRFRRIMGMSETISAWSWPELETIQAVLATLADRVQRLNIEIAEIEVDARQYASSAEEFAQLTREAKIAEATYTVLIEQVWRDQQPAHPAIDFVFGDPRVVALAELVTKQGMRDRINQPRQQTAIVGQDVAVVHRDRLRPAGG